MELAGRCTNEYGRFGLYGIDRYGSLSGGVPKSRPVLRTALLGGVERRLRVMACEVQQCAGLAQIPWRKDTTADQDTLKLRAGTLART